METILPKNGDPWRFPPFYEFLAENIDQALVSIVNRIKRRATTPEQPGVGWVRGTVVLSLRLAGMGVEAGHIMVLPCALAAWAPLVRPPDVEASQGETRIHEINTSNPDAWESPVQTPPRRRRRPHPLFLPTELFDHIFADGYESRVLNFLQAHFRVAFRSFPSMLLHRFVRQESESALRRWDAPPWLAILSGTATQALFLPFEFALSALVVKFQTGCKIATPPSVSNSSRPRRRHRSLRLPSSSPSKFQTLASRLTSAFTLDLLHQGSLKSLKSLERSLLLASLTSAWSGKRKHLLQALLACLGCVALEGAWEMVLVRWAFQDLTNAGSQGDRIVLFEGWLKPWPRFRRRSPASREKGRRDLVSDQERRIVEVPSVASGPSPLASPPTGTMLLESGVPQPEEVVQPSQPKPESPGPFLLDGEEGVNRATPAPSVAPSTTTPSERLVEGSQASEVGFEAEEEPVAPSATNVEGVEVSPSPSHGRGLHSSQETVQRRSLLSSSTSSVLDWRDRQYLVTRRTEHPFSPHVPGSLPLPGIDSMTTTSFDAPPPPAPQTMGTAPIINLRPPTLRPYPPNAFETLAIIVAEEGAMAPLRGAGSKLMARAFASFCEVLADAVWERR